MRPQRPCAQPHGTIARYTAGCSCLACCDARRDYQREWKLDPGRTVDAAPVAARIETLLRNGWRTRAIAEQAGVSYNTVRYCHNGWRPGIRRDSAAAIMSLPAQAPIPTASSALVPARAALRLIERLQADGFPTERIAQECGVSRRSLPQRGQRSVQARTYKRLVDASARLRAAS
jgi:AraC-like DNA-binding protein